MSSVEASYFILLCCNGNSWNDVQLIGRRRVHLGWGFSGDKQEKGMRAQWGRRRIKNPWPELCLLRKGCAVAIKYPSHFLIAGWWIPVARDKEWVVVTFAYNEHESLLGLDYIFIQWRCKRTVCHGTNGGWDRMNIIFKAACKSCCPGCGSKWTRNRVK